MGIQLISISHKTAPISIREHFTFNEENAIAFMKEMKACEGIEEVVLLSTCNRTEIYCSGENDKRNLKKMQELLIGKANMDSRQIPDYIMRYSGENAIHHLFMVTAGLDSALLGENQILGQVKNAFFTANQAGMCKGTFHALFQAAITAAKEVNTKTVFSKTPISSASLSIKQMQKEYGSLSGKKMMIIGAGGNLGGILLKDALDIEGLEIYVTTRQEIFTVNHTTQSGNTHDREKLPIISQRNKLHGKNRYYNVIPYQDRYLWAGECDIIVSVTRSPHYTIRKDKLSEHMAEKRTRLFFDLAVPQDIEESIDEIEGCVYYSLEEIEEMARKNNELKKEGVVEAKVIIRKYEEDFLKDEYYRKSRHILEGVMDNIFGTRRENNYNGTEKKLQKIFFRLKKNMTSEEFKHLLNILEKEGIKSDNQTKETQAE